MYEIRVRTSDTDHAEQVGAEITAECGFVACRCGPRRLPSAPNPAPPGRAPLLSSETARPYRTPMSTAQTLLPELDQEIATTRRLLERVPTEKGPWKPHPKSFSLGHLAQLVAWMPG